MRQHILVMGGVIIDYYLMLKEYPKRGQDALIEKSFQRVGGCALNVAVTLQNLGMVPHIVSVLGSDERGKEIYTYLRKENLSTEAIRVCEDKNTGFCLTLVEKEGERTFLTYKGCEAEFYSDMIRDELHGKVSMIFVTGYYLLDRQYDMAVVDFIRKMKTKGVKILFDPGPLVSGIRRDVLLSVIELADIMTPNEEELEKISAIFHIGSSGVPGWFFDKGLHWLIEKKGCRGVHVWEQGKEAVMVPAYETNSIDTAGAGDSFAGGIIYGVLKNHPLEKTVRIASACGALTTTVVGPHMRFNREKIEEMAGEWT